MSKNTPSRCIAFYSLKTQHSNLGDWLINRLLINELEERIPVYLDITGVPYEFYNGISKQPKFINNYCGGHSMRSLQFWISILLDRQAVKFLFMTPGHIGSPTGWGRLSFYLNSFISFLLRICGVKCIRFGCSFGDLDILNKIAMLFISRATVIRTRDSSLKAEYLCKSAVVPDLIVLTQSIKPSADHDHYIVISFRNEDKYRKVESVDLEKIEVYSSLIKKMIKHYGLEIKLAWQVDVDEQTCKMIKDSLGSQGDAISIISVNKENYQSLYRNAYVVLSNRLHVSLTTLTLGGSSVGVVDSKRDHKILDCYASLGLGYCLIGDDSDDLLEAIIIKVEAVRARRVEIDKALVKSRQSLRDELSSILGGGGFRKVQNALE